MKLCAVHVAALDDGGKRIAVVGGRKRHFRHGRRVAVNEVHVVATRDVIQQRRRSREFELVPTHVRNGKMVAIWKSPYTPGKQAEARHIAFFRRLEHQLHADANTEQRLFERANRLDQARTLQATHAIRRGADARKQHMARRLKPRRIGREVGFDAEPLNGELKRCDVRAAAVDDGQASHQSVPFVLGSSVSVMRNACRSVRPTPLKHASIMWCVLSPSTLMLIAAPSVSASERKKCGTSSVGSWPTLSRPNLPSNTK